MSEINQVKNSLKEEFEKRYPSRQKVFSFLFNLRLYKNEAEIEYPNDKWSYVSDDEFFDIVGEIFNENPEFYMKKLYKRIRKRIRKLYGIDKLIEMEKFILESYCLYTGEQILLDFKGELRFFENPTLRSRGTVVNGTLYVTNKRNIVQGRIYATGGSTSFGAASRKRIIKFSQQEKCYGYIFPNRKGVSIFFWPK